MGANQLSFGPSEMVHHPRISWHKEKAIFSKLIVTARKKTIIERVSPFDLDSNSNSQSAIHLSKKTLFSSQAVDE